MSLARVLREAPRFEAAFRDLDIGFEPAPRPTATGAICFATDRSGGEFVVCAGSGTSDRAGVWHEDSEGSRRWLAPDLVAFLDRIARGFTVADLAAGAHEPTGRALPGVLRWVSSLSASA